MSAEQPTAPPFADNERAFVIVDSSAWIHKAFHRGEANGMLSFLCGWLARLVAWNPGALAFALDNRSAHRHAAQHPTDPEWVYKANRIPLPPAARDAERKFLEIVEAHAIPLLDALDHEADDVIATVSLQAVAIGYEVAIATCDKDLCACCAADAKGYAVAYLWCEGVPYGPANVEQKLHPGPPGKPPKRYGLRPDQVSDALAIIGDTSDSIPGVDGLGHDKAFALLAEFGSLDAALDEPIKPADWYEAAEAALRELARRIKKGDAARTVDSLAAERDTILSRRALAKWHAALVAAREAALFSQSLTQLRFDVPIDVPWHQIPLGSLDVPRIVERYEALGFTRLARELEARPLYEKREPWAAP